MANAKTTKRALFASSMSMLLCVSMLIGSTFAWFTDTASTGMNKIMAGNLNVELYMKSGNDYVNISEDEKPIFGSYESTVAQDNNLDTLWEPGKTQVAYLMIKNAGNLALKYQVALNTVNPANSNDLYKVMEYQIVPDAQSGATWTAGAGNSVTPGTAIVSAENVPMQKGDEHYFALLVHMDEEAGNEYMNGKVEFDISVLATQLNAEEDSFGDQYDEEAAYGTYIELDDNEDLLAAMASAESGKPLTIKLKGNVEWPTEGHHGENDISPASSIVIDGNGYTLTATGAGVTPLGDTEAPMTLKNIKIVDDSESYNEGAWEFTYLEMGGSNLNCYNVTFADEIQTGTNATFTNCSFESNEASVYAVWVENGSATFNNCNFTGYRGLKAHEAYGSEINSVVVKGCTFNNISKKPGIALGTLNSDTTVSITDSAFLNCQAGDQRLYIYETDTDVTTFNFTNKNNLVEGYISTVEIDTKADLVAFAERVNGGDGMSNILVKLTKDIDLAGVEWIPVGQTGTSYGATSYFKGIFDGQGHTISNMTITNTNAGKNYAAGFFGFIDAADAKIRNVNFDKATVNGHHWTGIVAGYLTGTIDNCKVTNSTVKCTHANDDACGDKAGAIVGYVNSGLVNNCSVSYTTVTAGRDAGQVAGASETDYVSNCTADNVTVTATGDCTGANINNTVIGRKL